MTIIFPSIRIHRHPSCLYDNGDKWTMHRFSLTSLVEGAFGCAVGTGTKVSVGRSLYLPLTLRGGRCCWVRVQTAIIFVRGVFFLTIWFHLIPFNTDGATTAYGYCLYLLYSQREFSLFLPCICM